MATRTEVTVAAVIVAVTQVANLDIQQRVRGYRWLVARILQFRRRMHRVWTDDMVASRNDMDQRCQQIHLHQ